MRETKECSLGRYPLFHLDCWSLACVRGYSSWLIISWPSFIFYLHLMHSNYRELTGNFLLWLWLSWRCYGAWSYLFWAGNGTWLVLCNLFFLCLLEKKTVISRHSASTCLYITDVWWLWANRRVKLPLNIREHRKFKENDFNLSKYA